VRHGVFRPSGAGCLRFISHGLRRGLHSVAASRLSYVFRREDWTAFLPYPTAALCRRSAAQVIRMSAANIFEAVG
jgi:hypothetical protein